jgi:hypothetical protein
MKKLLAVIVVLMGLITAKSFAITRDKWENHEIFLQSIFINLTIIDLMHTYTFLYTEPYISQGYYEKNYFLGEHPSKIKFFTLGISGILIHTGISHALHYLPTKINKFLIPAWQMLYIGSEIEAINCNYKMGVRINF